MLPVRIQATLITIRWFATSVATFDFNQINATLTAQRIANDLCNQTTIQLGTGEKLMCGTIYGDLVAVSGVDSIATLNLTVKRRLRKHHRTWRSVATALAI